MKRHFLLYVFGMLVSCTIAQIHVSPIGNDLYEGTQFRPFSSIQHAVNVAMPGDTIWVHAGVYRISECIRIPEKQTSAERRCYLWSANDGEVIVDGSAMRHTTQEAFKNGRCIYLNHLANYWHFKGIVFCNAEDNGMKVEGSYNIIEQCVFHDNNDTGLQIGMGMVFDVSQLPQNFPIGEPLANPGYRFCRGNLVINCDSYNNADLRTYNALDNGGDADGFACKLYPGPGTEFHGCRAWNNSDDNWDLYMVYHPVVIDSCWAYHAGYTIDGKAIGNGNGFKLGGGGSSGGVAFPRSVGVHVVSNCISFGNLDKGFDQNGAAEGMVLVNNTAWGNSCNYGFYAPLERGDIYVRHCIGFKAGRINHVFLPELEGGSLVDALNSWTLLDKCNPYKEGDRNKEGINAKAADYSQEFVSLSVDDFKASRKLDGSLPDNGFGRLKENSVLRSIRPVTLPLLESVPTLQR